MLYLKKQLLVEGDVLLLLLFQSITELAQKVTAMARVPDRDASKFS
jgi:hypothetical protein